MGFRYPQPDNEDDFEQLCLRLYRKVWKNENLKLFAKRGEKQDGLDIFDPLFLKPVRAVQCKHHEPSKTISPAEIKAEVSKVENSQFTIDHYVIATTAKKSRNAQETVLELNQRSDKKFTLDIHFWEDLCQHASELGRVMAELIIYGENILAGAIAAAQDGGAVVAISPAGPEQADEDQRYAAVEALLNDRRFEVARYELDQLAAAVSAKALPASDEYKLLRLRAKLELETGGFETAGRLFLQAHAVAPDLDQAKENQVLAFALLGNIQKAYALATDYVAGGLATPVMILRLIESTTTPDQLQEHASVIESHRESDEGVNTALAHKYFRFGEFDRAREAAERALKIKPNSPYAHFAAAIAVHSQAVHGDLHERSKRLRVAFQHYDAALSVAREKQFKNLLPEILTNRAAAMILSGEMAAAAADFRAAVEATARPSIYAAPAIRFFLHENDFESARALLDALDPGAQETQYLELVTKYPTGDAQEKRKCLEQMKTLADQAWESAVECRFQCVQWALELKDPHLAESCVSAAFQEEHFFQAHSMLAWIRLESQDQVQAKAEAAKALDASIRSAHPQEIRILAHILVKLKDDANALGLLQQVAKPGVLDDDMKMLIECAQRLERHDLLLRICRELRASGAQDDHLRKLELQLLATYAAAEALVVADEFTLSSRTPWYFVAAKNYVAARLNARDKLNLDPSALPTPAQLTPADACLVIFPYVAAGLHADALRFLYAHVRLHFEDETAHGNYICFFLNYGQNTGMQEPAPVVDEQSAVLLQPGNGEHRWIVIEGDHPAASRDEFAAETEVGRVLIGRKVGDIVTLPGNPLQQETATIREVQTKYVRLFQDSFNQFVRRFPGTSMLQQLRVWNEGKFDPSVIIKSLKGRQEHAERCIELYRDHPCSLHFVAERLGITELELVKSLIQYPKGLVKCCQTSPTEFGLAVDTGVQSESVVIGMSAIITLSLTDSWKYLDTKKRYFVSQLTNEEIDGWIRIASEDKAEEGGMVSLNEAGQLSFRPTTEEDRAARFAQVRQMKSELTQRCEVLSSIAVADIPPEKRNQSTELLGPYNLEAISVAKDRNAMLWIDDLVVGFVANAEFGVKSMWTQLLLRCFVNSGSMSIADFNLVTAKLAAWNYVHTVWNPETIIAAGIAADWKMDSWPLPQCLALIAKSPLSPQARVPIVIGFWRLLRRSDCGELRQTPIIQATLDALGDARAVLWILRRIDQIFALDLESAIFIRPELVYWLRIR